MSFLKDQLPKALLDAVHAVNLGDTGVSEGVNNGTEAIEDRDYLFNKAIWETVSSQYVSSYVIYVCIALRSSMY